MSITGCCFSPSAKVLVTSSVDSEGWLYFIQNIVFQKLILQTCFFLIANYMHVMAFLFVSCLLHYFNFFF